MCLCVCVCMTVYFGHSMEAGLGYRNLSFFSEMRWYEVK